MAGNDTAVRVEIDRDDLEIRLYFARIGDKAASMRSWRNWFRRQSICASDERKPDCFSCQAFTRVEAMIGEKHGR